MKRQAKDGKPFFIWWNTTHMHFRTHVRARAPRRPGQTALPIRRRHDRARRRVGKILEALDELGIADNTIVVYSTDNGPHKNTWPDGGITPFRSEKNTNWEGAFRVPAMIRWPGQIPAGVVLERHRLAPRLVPTLLAAAGDPDVKERLLAGTTRRQGVQGPPRRLQHAAYLTGKSDESARKEFFYFNDDGEIVGVRYENWKIVFLEQRARAPCRSGRSPSCSCACRRSSPARDPYERADIASNTY